MFLSSYAYLEFSIFSWHLSQNLLILPIDPNFLSENISFQTFNLEAGKEVRSWKTHSKWADFAPDRMFVLLGT